MTGENNPAKRPEVRKKLRLKAIERINNNLQSGYQLTPFYNPIGCIIINEYGNKHGFNFQHAENGGEYHIKELGYWVDGYDKEKNTVIEVDEPEHFTIEGNLIEKDARRQSEIIEELKCDFIRIRVDNNNNILDVNIYPYNPTS